MSASAKPEALEKDPVEATATAVLENARREGIIPSDHTVLVIALGERRGLSVVANRPGSPAQLIATLAQIVRALAKEVPCTCPACARRSDARASH